MLNVLAEGGSFKIFLYLLGIITCLLLLSSFQSIKNVDLRLLMCICFNISFLGIALAVILPKGMCSLKQMLQLEKDGHNSIIVFYPQG